MASTLVPSLLNDLGSIPDQGGLGTRRRPRLSFLGCFIDDVTLDEAVALSRDAMKQRRRLQHGDINVAKFVECRDDRDLFRFTDESDLICADGMGIVWGCRLLGTSVRERVTGCDLMMRLIELCAREGFRPYFLGAKQEVLEAALDRVKRKYPELKVAGFHHGYFGRDQELDIVADIRAAGADCLFVGISTPIKERFLNAHRDTLNVSVQVGVGGSIDVLAERVRRAPAWMQGRGLEWIFRLSQEPSRLWRRYLFTNARFAAVIAMALANRLRRKIMFQAKLKS